MSFLERLRRRLSRRHIKTQETMFGTARIYEETWQGARLRLLDINGTHQSATFLGEHWCELPFSYLATFACIFDTSLRMRDLCMLGGGGYAFPKYVIAHHPLAHVDVVEVDPAITALARSHFFLDRLIKTYRTEETERLRLVQDDALSHLRRCEQVHKRYDAILDDCFVVSNHADTLLTPEAARLTHACLAPKGLYLVNMICSLEGASSQPLMTLVAALGQSFAHIQALPCDKARSNEPDNVVVVASDADPNIPGAIHLLDSTP